MDNVEVCPMQKKILVICDSARHPLSLLNCIKKIKMNLKIYYFNDEDGQEEIETSLSNIFFFNIIAKLISLFCLI